MGEVLLTTLISMGLMKLMWITLLFLLIWLPSVIYCLHLGKQKNSLIVSLLKGILFGPIGVLLVQQSRKTS